MNKKFEIVLEFIKDLSVETKDVETLVTLRYKINNSAFSALVFYHR